MIKAALNRAHPLVFSLYGGLFAFSAYFSMYAFRKPFAAATFSDIEGWAFLFDFKVAIVISQMIGYALSKFIGVKVVSEMPPARRGFAIIGLVAASWAALVLFAVAPPMFKIAALFLNGLPLGMIWGLVFGYLEGRRTTEILVAILCASFIVSSGVVKAVGVWFMTALNVPELWMPAVTGAVFFPLLLLSVVGLSTLPAPTEDDIAVRSARGPMNASQRLAFFRRYMPGLVFLIVAYVLFALIREFRDSFAAELWEGLGVVGAADVFALSEIPVAILTFTAMASLVLIRSNLNALVAAHVMVLFGAVLAALSTFAFQNQLLTPMAWMIASGAGLYLSYTPFNAVLFDRLIGATKQLATAGFLIYVADASGYAGTVGLLIYKSLTAPALDWLSFYQALLYVSSAASAALIAASAVYFVVILRREQTKDAAQP